MRPTIQPPPAEPPPVIMPTQGPPAAQYRPVVVEAPTRWRYELLRLALELPLVFLSVFLAFMAADYQEAQERERRREQLRNALRAEVADIGRGTAGLHASLTATLARYDSAAQAGAPLPLGAVLGTGAPPAHMWQTAVESGGLELLDVETTARLSAFYNSLRFGQLKYDQLRDLSERYLIPVTGAPASTFWLPNDVVRPQYAWYFATMRELAGSTAALAAEADSLVVALGQ